MQISPTTPPHGAAALQRLSGCRSGMGGTTLRHVLPARERSMIGAWCFLEHTCTSDGHHGGESHASAHPHAGMQSFTWMIEGELLHRDSLGNMQAIRPGAVNLLTAGRGITHVEETPAGRSQRVRSAQLWIALPEAFRECAPSFAHYPELPKFASSGFRLTLMVGQLFGERSPVAVYSPLIGIELVTNGAAATTMPLRGDFEYGVLVLEGDVIIAGERLFAGELLYVGEHQTRLGLRCEGPASLLLLGGKPLDEAPLAWWNFVGRDRDDMVGHARHWNAGDACFGVIPGHEKRGYDGARLAAPEPPAGMRPAR